jgi:hypothetical protein
VAEVRGGGRAAGHTQRQDKRRQGGVRGRGEEKESEMIGCFGLSTIEKRSGDMGTS